MLSMLDPGLGSAKCVVLPVSAIFFWKQQPRRKRNSRGGRGGRAARHDALVDQLGGVVTGRGISYAAYRTDRLSATVSG